MWAPAPPSRIDAATGKIKWRFQEQHHGIFDLDTNAAPAPVTITKDGKRVKVVVQPTKQAMIWILDAATGKPIHPWEERPVAQSQIPGEKSSPTQPFTISPPPLIPATVKRDQLSQLSAQANAECKALFDERKLEDVGPFSPPKGGGVWALNASAPSAAWIGAASPSIRSAGWPSPMWTTCPP